MPPEVGKAGDIGATVVPQAPILIEETKTTEINKKSAPDQKQQLARQDAETAAKNTEAAKQLAADTRNIDTARVKILKNQLAEKLPEREKQPGNGQTTAPQSNKTLKDQLAETIAKGPDGPKILKDTAPVQAGPTGGKGSTVESNSPKPSAGGEGRLTSDQMRAEVERHLNMPRPDPKAPMTIKTPKGSEKITFGEYERRWNAASNWVGEESRHLSPQSKILERREDLYKLAQEKFGLPENWQTLRNDPKFRESWQHLPRDGGGGSGGGPQGTQGNSGTVDPHAKTEQGGGGKGAAAAEKEAGAAGKVATAAEKGPGKAAGATEKAAAASAAKAAEGAGTAAKITSGGAKAAEAVAHMSPVVDALMVEFDYFASYAKAHDIIRERNTENGFAVGMAASLMGAPPEKLMLRAIDRDVAIQVLGAEGIGEKSHNKGVSDGYKYAQSLSADERNKLREQAFKTLASRGYHTANPKSFDQTDVIYAAGTMVPGVKHLFAEARKMAEAEELRARKENKPVYGSRF